LKLMANNVARSVKTLRGTGKGWTKRNDTNDL
jgi:hypothetical protein